MIIVIRFFSHTCTRRSIS